MKKKVVLLACLSLFAAALFASGSSEASSGPGGNLVLYSSANDEEYYMIVDAFQAKYPNINIQVVQGGTGELLARETAEAANPQADVQFGGLSYSHSVSYADLWEEYVSPNNENLPEAFRAANNKVTLKSLNLQVLLVNRALESDLGFEISTLDDILRPELKGRISFADPNLGSTAYKWLTTILYVKGNGNPESDEAWGFVEALIQNLDGKLANSTGTAHRSVRDGEYTVGFTSESNANAYIEEGFGNIVRVVIPQEGTTAPSYGCAIIKGAKNLENAKLFIDFIISDEAQQIYAGSSFRPANTKFTNTRDYFVDINTVNLFTEDDAYVSENQQAILTRFNNLWAKYN